MARGRPTKEALKAQSEGSKERLVQAGKKLFAERGYAGTSVKELCTEADVNVSLISYYFDGKEGLYRAVLDQFGKTKLASVERLLQPVKSAEELRIRLQMFVEDILHGFVEEPDLTTIIYRETESPSPDIEDIFRARFIKLFDTIVEFFDKAQKSKVIRQDVDPKICATLLFGGLSHYGRMDKTVRKFKRQSIQQDEYRQKIADHVIPVFLEGILQEQ